MEPTQWIEEHFDHYFVNIVFGEGNTINKVVVTALKGGQKPLIIKAPDFNSAVMKIKEHLGVCV